MNNVLAEMPIDNLEFNDWADLNTWDDLCRRPERFLSPTYRMPERDKITGPKTVLPDGALISFQRVVARVGYQFGVHSVTRRQWLEAGAEIVAKNAGIPIETVKQVILATRLDSPFKGIKSEIYNALIRPLIAATPAETRNVRAMWFYDYSEPYEGRIVGRVRRYTGKRNEGHYGGGGWGDEPEYDPPSLDYAHGQALYEVAPSFFNSGTIGNLLVYPTDATERTAL